MFKMSCRAIAVTAVMILMSAAPASATDGHLLHGVGAINSALGGIGIASSPSVLGAFYVNPAGLAQFSDTRFELGFEMFKPNRTISSSAGPYSGSTTSSSQFVPIPAFAWAKPVRNNSIVVGLAGIGAGGFGVDYHLDATNPILAPRPYGFGQVFSNFQLMKIVPAIAMRVTSSLRVGLAANFDWASLSVDPMPTAAPAVDPGPDGMPNTRDDRAYYSRATDANGAFGIGLQAGLQYDLLHRVTVGLSYATPQRFQKFEFGGVYENPNLPNFNTARKILFAMDVPAIYGAGISFNPIDRVSAGFDAKYITYAETRGFKESGFASDGAVKGFGWKNIWSYSAGLQLLPTDRIAARFGYNYSDNPIPDEMAMFNAPAPAVVKHHATLGAGYRISDGFGIDVAYYHAFRNSISGLMETPAGSLPGTSVKSSMSENSILMSFTYSPKGLTR